MRELPEVLRGVRLRRVASAALFEHDADPAVAVLIELGPHAASLG